MAEGVAVTEGMAPAGPAVQVKVLVVGLTLAGYLFGNLPFVQTHLSKIIWALILVPGLIAIFGAWRARKAG